MAYVDVPKWYRLFAKCHFFHVFALAATFIALLFVIFIYGISTGLFP